MKKLLPLFVLPFVFLFTACPGDEIDERVEHKENTSILDNRIVDKVYSLLCGNTFIYSGGWTRYELNGSFIQSYEDKAKGSKIYFSKEIFKNASDEYIGYYYTNFIHCKSGLWHLNYNEEGTPVLVIDMGGCDVLKENAFSLVPSSLYPNLTSPVKVRNALLAYGAYSAYTYPLQLANITTNSISYESSREWNNEITRDKANMTLAGSGNLTGVSGTEGIVGGSNTGGGTGTGGNTGGGTSNDDSFYIMYVNDTPSYTSATVAFQFSSPVSSATVKYGENSCSTTATSNIAANRVTAYPKNLKRGTTYMIECTAKGKNGITTTAIHFFVTRQ